MLSAAAVRTLLAQLRGHVLPATSAVPGSSAAWLSGGPASRQQQAQQPPISVTAIKLHKARKVLEVAFSDGGTSSFSAELLRVLSPSAENCESAKVVGGRRHVGIMRVEAVGRYAVRLHFDDLHNSGLYTHTYLRELAGQRFSRAKAYVTALRKQGLSRDRRRHKG